MGVTVRGQAVMLNHDRRLERLAEGLEAEARTPCALVYDHLRAELATRNVREAVGTRMLLAGAGLWAEGADGAEELEEYVDGCRKANQRRLAVKAHTVRLTQISVLAGGPPHLAHWASPGAPHDYRVADAVVRQAQHRAKAGIVERLLPGLFLGAGYPIVARHPPSGPGVRRGACWHVTVVDLTPDDVYPVVTTPHPDGRGRVCHAVTVPLSPDWYRDVYAAGAAVVDGCLVLKLGEPGSGGGDAHGALLFVQRGARMHLEDHPIAPTPAGWKRLPRTLVGALGRPRGTGVRPSPWD